MNIFLPFNLKNWKKDYNNLFQFFLSLLSDHVDVISPEKNIRIFCFLDCSLSKLNHLVIFNESTSSNYFHTNIEKEATTTKTWLVTYKTVPIKESAKFSTETCKSEGSGLYLNFWQKNCQLRILYQAKLSLNYKEK